MAKNPLKSWQVERDAIRFVGKNLQRPECILAERDGTLWSADARGGVMKIAPNGQQTLIAQTVSEKFEVGSGPERFILQGTLPNGLAFNRKGDIIIANFGTDCIELMTRDGESRTLFSQIDGVPLGKTNFVLTDSKDRIWFTVTTRTNPWTKSITEKIADGWVGVADEKGIRLIADGFCGTNEIRFDANEEWLYVVESNARRISRLRLDANDKVTHREIYGPSDLGGIPDGFTFDSYGNLWITLVLYDQLIALTPDGEKLMLLDDGSPENTAFLDKHFHAGTMSPQVMAAAHGTLAPWMASLTFGGADLKTAYIGSLMGTTIPVFTSPVAGLPLSHWK